MSKDFKQWMRSVDQILEKRIGLTSNDLPDQDYFGMWDGSLTPSNAASEVIRVEQKYLVW